MMSKKPSLKINAMSNWASLGVNILIGLFLTPYIIKNLGKQGYGMWILVGSFIGYYGLLNLGVGSAITRYIARYTAQKEANKLNEVASTSLVMFCVTGAIAIFLSFVFSGIIADFFEVSLVDRPDFIRLIRIVGIATGISFPCGVLGACISAREHFVALNIITILRSILRSLLVVVFIKSGLGVVGVGLAPLIATSFTLLFTILLFYKYASDIKLSINFANLKSLKVLLMYGGVTTIIAIADILRINIDSFVIGKFVSLDAVGVYGVAALIIGYLVRIIGSANSVLNPRFSSLDGLNDKAKIEVLLMRSLKVSSFLGFSLVLMTISFGPKFILLWAGSEYSEAIPVLTVLCVSYAFALVQNPGIPLLFALNKHKYYALFTVIEGFLNILISIILVFKYSILGVALGTMISMLVIKILVMPYYIARTINVPIMRYISCILPYAIISSIIFVILRWSNFTEYSLNLTIFKYVMILLFSCLVIVLLMLTGLKNEFFKKSR